MEAPETGPRRPAVSVVVPLYNKRDAIRGCLGAVLRQTLPQFEVIVVDDGSTDGGGDIVRQIADGRVRVVAQENRGASAARNRGIAESRGELVALLDADDEWEPDFLETMRHLAAVFPNAGIYAAGLRRLKSDGSSVEIFASLAADPGLVEDYFGAPQEGLLFAPSCAVLRRSVLADIGGYPEGEPVGEDLDLWVRVALKYGIACTRRVLVTYHVDEEGDRGRRRLAVKQRPYPIHVRTLKTMLAAGSVPAEKLDHVRRYVDYHAMDFLECLLVLEHPTANEQVLSERFHTTRYRLEAAFLRALARCLPPRMVWLLRWGPVALLRKLARRFRRRMDQAGRVVCRRNVPAPRVNRSEGAGG
ncbi:MAG: glycosyltransferase family A protein [Bryobacteraceae bacterium]